MVAMYTIAGRQIGSHWLAMLTLGTVGGLVTVATRGPAKSKTPGPPINASSPDEEKYIQDFLKQVEGQEKK